MIIKPKDKFILENANNLKACEIARLHPKYLYSHLYINLKKLTDLKYLEKKNGKYTTTRMGKLLI